MVPGILKCPKQNKVLGTLYALGDVELEKRVIWSLQF